MAPVQAQEVTTRDPRVRQTLELQKKEEVRNQAGGISPRSRSFIDELTAVLEPYNYGEAEILSLVKRCSHDLTRIQAAVANILEDKRGHEHEEWSTTATASEKKLRAQEAKERRLQREKELAEEVERQRAQRTKAADEKMQQAQKRRSADADKSQQGLSRGPGRGGSSTVCAWRPMVSEGAPSADANDDGNEVTSEDTTQEPTPESQAQRSAEDNKQDTPTQEHSSTESNLVSTKAKEPTEHPEEPTVEQAIETACDGSRTSSSAQAPKWGSAPVGLPEAGHIWTSPAPTGGWGQPSGGGDAPSGVATAHPQEQGDPWASPWLSDTGPWNHSVLGPMPERSAGAVPSSAGLAPAAEPAVAWAQDGGPAPGVSALAEVPPLRMVESSLELRKEGLDSPSVVMPASYAALIGTGPEPMVMFGSIHVSDPVPKADPLANQLQPIEEKTASQLVEADVVSPPQEGSPEQEPQQWKEKPQRSTARQGRGEAWAPRIKAWAPRSPEAQEAPVDPSARPPKGGKGRGSGKGLPADASANGTDGAPGSGPQQSEGGSGADGGKGSAKGDGKGRPSKKGSAKGGARKGAGKGWWTERQRGGAGK